MELCPENIVEGNGDQARITNGDEIYQWWKRDCYARLIIFNSNDDVRQKALLNCKTANEMWTRLTTQYLQRAADNKHLLHREFITLRYETTIIEHNATW